MNIIIPIGGKGERFLNAGYTERKPLISILDKYMIFYVLDNLKVNVEDNIYIIYNQVLDKYNFSELVSERYNNITLIRVSNTKGAVETIKLGLEVILKKKVHDKCVIMDCDTFYTEDVINMYRNINSNAVFYIVNKEEKPIYSYIILDDNDIIIDIKEKIKISDNANVGIYCFNNIKKLYNNCVKLIEQHCYLNIELYTSMMIKSMIEEKEIFRGILLDEKYVFNLGTPQQIETYLKRTLICLFDLDGTLVLTDNIYKDVWKTILKQHNIILDNELYNKYIYGKTDKLVANTLLKCNDYFIINQISMIKDELFINQLSKIEIVEQALEFITNLYKNGHKVSIVTNCNRKVAESIISNCKLQYDYIIIGNECIKPKPDPEPYIKAMNKYKTDRNIIIFEDSLSGINSALGIYPKCLVGIETQYDSKTLVSYGVNLTINNYKELKIHDIEEIDNFKLLNLKKMIMNSINILNIKNIENIMINNTKIKCGFICDIINVNIKSDNVSHNCIFKIDNKKDTFLASVANNLDLYEREYYFYEHISKYVNIKIPKYYGTIKDNNSNNIGILLGNLFEENCTNNIDLNNEKIDISLNIIKHLTLFHSKFWNKQISNKFSKLKKNNDSIFQPSWKTFIDSRINIFKEKWKNILSNEQLEITYKISENFIKIQNRLSEGHLTICHGDFKSPNMFFSQNMDPVFIDWQYVCIGKGVQDLVFFMIESFDTSNIKNFFTLFKDYYYIKILENGVKNYSIENYNRDFIDSIFYFPFFVVIWFGTIKEDELLDKNFPYFFIKKFYNFIELTKSKLSDFSIE